MLEKIEEYLKTIDITMLTWEELEHYTNICIAIEKKYLDAAQRSI